MPIPEALPIIIPGVLLQLSIQAYYIRHCLKNPGLSPRQRLMFTVAIAIGSLPAVAVYLFKTPEKMPAGVLPEEIQNAPVHTRRGIFLLLMTAYEVQGLHLLAENTGHPFYGLLAALLVASFLAMVSYNLLPEQSGLASGAFLPMLQLLLCAPIVYLDRSGDNLYLALIAGIAAINHAALPRSKVYGIGGLSAYLTGSTAKTVFLSGASEMSEIVRYFYINTLVVLLALLAFYTLKKQMVTGGRLVAALHKLQEQAGQLKGMAVAEERSRITAQIHDTAGHALTGAVIAIEGAQNLIPAENREALEKLSLAKQQVRLGLDGMRSSVRAIRRGEDQAFAPALSQLLGEIFRTTGLAVDAIVEVHADLLPIQQHILLQAVKECATNSVRHGASTGADVLVQEYKGHVRLTFSDNGRGAEPIVFGFGLSSMRERVESIGGTLAADSAGGDGFTVGISIPIGLEQEGAEYE